MKYLIITADFAPRGASPAIRKANLVKALANTGHQVEVITYDEETLTIFSPHDVKLSQKVPLSVRVHRIPAGILRRFLRKFKKKDSASINNIKKKILRSVISALLIPDSHIDAIVRFINKSKAVIKAFEPDVIITHSYPFSTLLVGFYLKNMFPNLIWVADYGDPWTGSPSSEIPLPNWRKALDFWLEKSILKRVDLISVTTNMHRSLYQELFHFTKDRMIIIPMGFDPDDFRTIAPIERAKNLTNKFLMVHTGRIYSEARNPSPFIKATEMLFERNKVLAEKLRIVLVGNVEEEVRLEIQKSTSAHLFVFVPWVPVHESIAWMKCANMLLLFGNKGNVQIPGKVYQYLGCAKPIFMTRLTHNDPTEKIVQKARYAKIVTNESENIMFALEEVLTTALDNKKKENLMILEFSWPKLAIKLNREVQNIWALKSNRFTSVKVGQE